MFYYEEDIENLINSLDIVDIIGRYVPLKKAGSSYKGICPFHSEKTPSFVVSPVKKIFKCFGCGVSGNAFSFFMKYNSLDFRSAVEELAKLQHFKLRVKEHNSNYVSKISVRERLYDMLFETMKYFNSNIFLETGKEGLKYFESRGFDIEFISNYNLGYAKDDWTELIAYLKKIGYSEEEMLKAGLIKKGEKGYYSIFRGRVIFPIFSIDGRVIGFGGRIINSEVDAPKYLNSPDTDIFNKGKNLYGIFDKGEILRKKEYAILVEGYMDVLMAHNYGIKNVIASLGTSFTEEQAKLLKKYVSNVVIAYDMDDAGRSAVEKASYILKKNDFNVKVLTLDDAKDPDEFLRKYGKKEFMNRIKKSDEIFEFLYLFYSKNIDKNDITGKKVIIEKFSNFMKNVANAIDYDFYLDKLSKNINIDKNILKENFKENKKIILTQFEKNKNDKIDKLELNILKLMLKDKEYINKFIEKIGNVKFNNELLGEIYALIIKNKENENLEQIIINALNEETIIANLVFESDFIENEEELFLDLINGIKKREYEEEKKTIEQMLLGGDLDENLKKDLINRYCSIVRKLKE